MKKKVFLILVLFVVFSLEARAGRLSQDERLDIGTIIKEITIPGGSQWAYVRVRAVVDSSPQAVWATLININGWPKWLPMTKKAWFLSDEAAQKITPEIARNKDEVLAIDARDPPAAPKQTHNNHWQRIAYEEYDLPWPLKNEWVVRRYTFDETDEINKASWRKVASTDSEDDGYWEITNWKDGKTHLRYYYRVRSKENVPQPLFKAAVSLTVNSMIKALRRESAKLMKSN